MIIKKVITGGQTGADQSGWRAARGAGIATGGWMPKGYLTEDGPRPEFAEMYGAKEHSSSSYPHRTRANITESDCTILFHSDPEVMGHPMSSGSRLAYKVCKEVGRRLIQVRLWYFHPTLWRTVNPDEVPDRLAEIVASGGYHVLNIAGNRESSAPGIGAWVEQYMSEVFRIIRARGD